MPLAVLLSAVLLLPLEVLLSAGGSAALLRVSSSAFSRAYTRHSCSRHNQISHDMLKTSILPYITGAVRHVPSPEVPSSAIRAPPLVPRKDINDCHDDNWESQAEHSKLSLPSQQPAPSSLPTLKHSAAAFLAPASGLASSPTQMLVRREVKYVGLGPRTSCKQGDVPASGFGGRGGV